MSHMTHVTCQKQSDVFPPLNVFVTFFCVTWHGELKKHETRKTKAIFMRQTCQIKKKSTCSSFRFFLLPCTACCCWGPRAPPCRLPPRSTCRSSRFRFPRTQKAACAACDCTSDPNPRRLLLLYAVCPYCFACCISFFRTTAGYLITPVLGFWTYHYSSVNTSFQLVLRPHFLVHFV
jgi:hypothetical protein